jgi:hypothetical protein
MSLVVKRYKKLVKELLFAYSELEYVEEVLRDAHGEFEMFYQDFCKRKNVPIGKMNEDNSEKLEKVYPKKEVKTDEEGIVQYEGSDKSKENHKVFQRMYRIIAKKLHPDKFSNQEQTPEVLEKIDAFKQATGAFSKNNWAKFLDICEKYDILPTRYEKINSLIRDEISDIGKKVNHKKLSFSWRLYECEDDDGCKEKIIKDFLYQLFKYRVQE